MTDHRYPIGKFSLPGEINDAQRKEWMNEIACFPQKLQAALADLTAEQLDTPYRPGGWTVRQVVHHLADSHMNSFMRFKLALTEDRPTIKPYLEANWAALVDAANAPIESSVQILEGLHQRWFLLLSSLSEEQFARVFIHPEHPGTGENRLEIALGIYAWHGLHHIAHITSLRERMGWS